MSEKRMGFICCQEWEASLIQELQEAGYQGDPLVAAPGLVICTGFDGWRRFDAVFARQWLPDCEEVDGHSIADFVAQMGVLVDPTLDNAELPWTVQVCTPDQYTLEGDHYADLYSRAGLLQEKFLERMKTYRRRAMARYVAFTDATKKCVVIQALLVKKGRLWVSVAEQSRLPSGQSAPLLWKGNPGNVPHASAAPCRSYYKLEEAWRLAGWWAEKNELCVDLGAAPGGWTWAALQRGARVIAVDSADLAEVVATHPRCDHRRDNGYEFMPSERADWLFCDMIVRPMATLGLLERWLAAGKCRNFVVNVKFRGRDIRDILIEIARLATTWQVKRLVRRHLYFDRNEITLIGAVD